MSESKVQLPKFGSNFEITIKGAIDSVEHFTYSEEAPKELMDIYQQLLGNAEARVTVSTDMGIKDFGTGCGGMVTVSLSCDQNAQSIGQAFSLAQACSLQYAKSHREMVEVELVKILEAKKAKGLKYGS